MAKISGTKEWASHNVNCVTGCSHNCRYCYARWNAVDRFHQVASDEDWEKMKVRDADVKKSRPKKEGTIMFPTTHDITPEVVDACLTVLVKMLESGNDVLVVTKPHLECIVKICDACTKYKSQILFRFTIGAMDDNILKYWEPGAPSFKERFAAMKYAFENGYATSVSMEPLLDAENVVNTFTILKPFVTNSIWIGKLNKIDARANASEDMIERIKLGQTDQRVREIYETLKDEPLVKWKESYKEVLGLDLATEKGMDV